MSAKSALDDMGKDFDYIRIPKKNILFWEMNNSINRRVETEIRFVGEPIFEKLQLSSSSNNWCSVTADANGIKLDADGIKFKKQVEADFYNMIKELDKNEEVNEFIKNMEEKKDMNKLLEIYKIKKIEKIDEKYSELRKGILQHDKLVQAAEEYNKKLEENIEDKTLLIEYKLNTERKVTIASQNILDDIEYRHEKEWEEIDNLIKTVEAHLDMANTFEEKEKVLKAYYIIDETGKLKVDEEIKNDVDFGKIEVEKQEPKKTKKTKKMFRKE